jgi:hypothetical protein
VNKRRDIDRGQFFARLVAPLLRVAEGGSRQLASAEREHPSYVTKERMQELLSPHRTMTPLRRIRSYMLDLPLHDFAKCDLFKVVTMSARVARRLGGVDEDAVKSPFDSIDKFAFVLALTAEALILDDYYRHSVLCDVVRHAFSAIREDEIFGQFAPEIWDLLESNLFPIEAVTYDWLIEDYRRKASDLAHFLRECERPPRLGFDENWAREMRESLDKFSIDFVNAFRLIVALCESRPDSHLQSGHYRPG